MAAEEETQRMVNEFQVYQQQMQSLLMQKENLKMQNIEVDKALEELNATKQKSAYKMTGNIMINKPVDELKKELQEMKEAVDVRMKSLEKTEEKFNDRLQELQKKLEGALK